MNWQEYTVAHSGLELAVMEYGAQSGQPVLALHGWRDNAASFAALAAELPAFRLIAPDFPGHGRSSQRQLQAGYSIWSYLDEVLALMDQRVGKSCVLLGHSMGGAVAALFAALYPERVHCLILLDSVGPLATAPEHAPAQMRNALDQLKARNTRLRRHYPDFAAAVAARARRGLGVEAATALAQRGVMQDEQGYYWNLDPRLSLPNPLSLTEEHAEAFIRQIACPVLLIAARGYWLQRKNWFQRRVAYFRNLELHELDGGHHQHMEAHASTVASLIRQFILNAGSQH